MFPDQQLGGGPEGAVAAAASLRRPPVDLHVLLEVVLVDEAHVAQLALELFVPAVDQLARKTHISQFFG